MERGMKFIDNPWTVRIVDVNGICETLRSSPVPVIAVHGDMVEIATYLRNRGNGFTWNTGHITWFPISRVASIHCVEASPVEDTDAP